MSSVKSHGCLLIAFIWWRGLNYSVTGVR